MKPISIMDTRISDFNLGNQIIMESVHNHLSSLFPDRFIYNIPYREITNHTLKIINESEMCFFGGTNSLCSEMGKYSQWGINKLNYKQIRNLILVGLGWWQYQEKVDNFTRKILKTLLDNKYVHSVRDSYTKKKLADIGITNIINTGCPSIWNLENFEIIDTFSDSVIFTITDYNHNINRDNNWLAIIKNRYRHIYCWLQGAGDLNYIKESNFISNIKFIRPRLVDFINFLSKMNVDYVGTRLHAGIQALQKKRKAFIIGIDNRASEMAKDFNLPVINESEINRLKILLTSNYKTNFNIPKEQIQDWKNQFCDAQTGSNLSQYEIIL